MHWFHGVYLDVKGQFSAVSSLLPRQVLEMALRSLGLFTLTLTSHISQLFVCCVISLALTDFAQHCAILKGDGCARMLIYRYSFCFYFLLNMIEFLIFKVAYNIDIVFSSVSYMYVGYRIKLEMLYADSKICF